MGVYQFFIILICYLCLLLNAVTADSSNSTYVLTVNFAEQNFSFCLEAKVPSEQCVAGRPYEKFKMNCQSNTVLAADHTFVWYRNVSHNRSAPIENDGRVQPKKGELFFTGLLQNDTNMYYCRVVKQGDEKKPEVQPLSMKTIELQVLPFMKKVAKDVTAIEENMINLTCTVLSNRTATVHWILNTPALNGSLDKSGDRIMMYDFNGTVNSVLSISKVNQSLDRGWYTCYAESEFGYSVNNMTMYIRVKGKYAALIPFLGICGEVIILCFIILIYEKKRDKTELEESDTDQGPETKSSPDHGQDSVRYRK